MKPHPMIRKTVKWGGAVVTALLIVAWIGSGWFYASWGWRSGHSAVISSGRAWVAYRPNPLGKPRHIGLLTTSRPFSFLWWSLPEGQPGGWCIGVPLWLPAGATLLITAAAWRFDSLVRRRACAGLCGNCRYDRAGLAPGAVCPECGGSAHA